MYARTHTHTHTAKTNSALFVVAAFALCSRALEYRWPQYLLSLASNSLKPTNAHFIIFGTLHVSLHVSIHMDHHQGTTRLLHIFILYIYDLIIVLWLS